MYNKQELTVVDTVRLLEERWRKSQPWSKFIFRNFSLFGLLFQAPWILGGGGAFLRGLLPHFIALPSVCVCAPLRFGSRFESGPLARLRVVVINDIDTCLSAFEAIHVLAVEREHVSSCRRKVRPCHMSSI